MLSKVKTTLESTLSTTSSWSSNSYSTTLTNDGYIKCTFSVALTTGNHSLTLEIGGTTVETKAFPYTASTSTMEFREVIFDTHCKKGDSITVTHNYTTGQAYAPCYYQIVYEMLQPIIDLKLYEVKNIGELVTTLLYGMDNGTYKGGIITGTDTTATTGNITLGNAVGFLEVNYNGTIVKVPYYN